MSAQLCFSVLEDIAKDLSGEVVAFPTFLDITFQVRTALKDPRLSIDRLARLVEIEPLMSTKVVRMANSAAMNPSGRSIVDVQSAIGRIGMDAVRSISFAVAMEQLLGSKDMAPFEVLSRELWEHSMQTAALCRVLARRVGGINPDGALFAGLVHDIGAFYLLSRVVKVPEFAEDRAFLLDFLVQWHENIGHALLAAMGLPEDVLLAVQEHEEPRELTRIKTVNDLVFVANRLANLRTRWRDDGSVPDPDDDYAELLGVESVDELLAESVEEVASLKGALGAR